MLAPARNTHGSIALRPEIPVLSSDNIIESSKDHRGPSVEQQGGIPCGLPVSYLFMSLGNSYERSMISRPLVMCSDTSSHPNVWFARVAPHPTHHTQARSRLTLRRASFLRRGAVISAWCNRVGIGGQFADDPLILRPRRP
jgi:hypothetical protein